MPDLRYSIEVLHPADLTLSRTQIGVGRAVLGRGAQCTVPIEARGVSREHVAIDVLPDGGATLTDLGSTNGSRVDGRTLGHRALCGDFLLELGDVRLRFREHEPELGVLVFRSSDQHGAEGGKDEPAADADRATRTRLNTPIRRLREAIAPLLPLRDGMASISAVLHAALAPLEARSLSLRDTRGRVLAAAGNMAGEEKLWVQSEHFAVFVDAESDPPDTLARAVREWLDWFGSPAPADVDASPSILSFPGVVGPGSSLQTSLRGLARVARSRVGVLILGESGTGKELVARWVHDVSPRAKGPFVAINCAALPRDLLEAELFGIEKGAATGVEARPGVFERAHQGTLFLDELGDMPLETQVRLLRAVEDGRIHRVGGKQLVEVDVRLVSATHADLQEAIEAQRFRLDLYHRIAGFEVVLPPLRERSGDIAPLAFHCFERALRDNGAHSPGMTEAALRCLRAWHWPGNVRELRQAIEGACALLGQGEALDACHLPARMRGASAGRTAAPTEVRDAPASSTLAVAVAAAEQAAILRALDAAGEDAEATWQLLGIGKTTFYKKLKEHGIQRESGSESDSAPKEDVP